MEQLITGALILDKNIQEDRKFYIAKGVNVLFDL